jgi:hypothetical protein
VLLSPSPSLSLLSLSPSPLGSSSATRCVDRVALPGAQWRSQARRSQPRRRTSLQAHARRGGGRVAVAPAARAAARAGAA